MKYIKVLFGLLLCTLFASCSDDKVPADADDNYITSVTLVSSENTYEAVITENTITVTVPYNVSLDGAKASFIYTPSAKILPDPNTITDWDIERTFRVTSYNGDIREYSYVVIKDEIRSEGDVELKNSDDIAKFVATGTTVVTGNLIIGSDAEDAEEITDISSLNLLKEVQGNVIIKKSYIGGTLTGLDNLTTIGGLEIGTAEQPNTNDNLELISLTKLNNCTGSITVTGSGVKIIEFKELDLVGGSIEFNTNTKLQSISFPKLREAGTINFAVLPRDFSTIELPELETVNGNFNIEGIFGDVHTGGMMIATGNTGLINFNGLDKLTTVKGTLSIQNFEELTSLPALPNLKQLGGIYVCRNNKIESLDLSNTDFIRTDNHNPLIKIENNRYLTELNTKHDLSCVDVWIYSAGYNVKTSIEKVNNFYFQSSCKQVEFTISEIIGSLELHTNKATKISFSNLTKVDGFLSIEASKCKNFILSKIENIGGQLYIQGGAYTSVSLDNLKAVCTSAEPQYKIEGNDAYGIGYGSLYLAVYSDVSLPSIEQICGLGLTIGNCYSFEAPILKTIDGKLSVEASEMSAEKLKLPKLENLSGVSFYKNTEFLDFSFFQKFINSGQISENNWLIRECGYNPTYQDMKEGRYSPAE